MPPARRRRRSPCSSTPRASSSLTIAVEASAGSFTSLTSEAPAGNAVGLRVVGTASATGDRFRIKATGMTGTALLVVALGEVHVEPRRSFFNAIGGTLVTRIVDMQLFGVGNLSNVAERLRHAHPLSFARRAR